jgi:hypothetical protein
MFDHIRAADRVVLLLNTLLLMVVAFLPRHLCPCRGAAQRTRPAHAPADQRGAIRVEIEEH